VIFRSVVALTDKTPNAIGSKQEGERGIGRVGLGRHRLSAASDSTAFDLNHRLETRLLMFARHLVEQGKWEQLTTFFDDRALV
jgi:hypothetical protein